MDQTSKMIRHFKKVENKPEKKQIRNIDFIYLINLDARPEKLKKTMRNFARYGISPHRFPAILGWGMPQETFDDIATPLLPGAAFDRFVSFRPGQVRFMGKQKLNEFSVGKHCVHYTTSAGALGCYLSHLSVLYDAYQSGYETIWVLEDDAACTEDPHVLIDEIDKLDSWAGPFGWDILFTNNEDHLDLAALIDVMGGGSMSRPGIPISQAVLEYQPLSPDFFKIGSRRFAHSMIIRRSGIEKILDFATGLGIFLPYDVELAFVPGIRLFNLSRDVVKKSGGCSDTSRFENFGVDPAVIGN